MQPQKADVHPIVATHFMELIHIDYMKIVRET